MRDTGYDGKFTNIKEMCCTWLNSSPLKPFTAASKFVLQNQTYGTTKIMVCDNYLRCNYMCCVISYTVLKECVLWRFVYLIIYFTEIVTHYG